VADRRRGDHGTAAGARAGRHARADPWRGEGRRAWAPRTRSYVTLAVSRSGNPCGGGRPGGRCPPVRQSRCGVGRRSSCTAERRSRTLALSGRPGEPAGTGGWTASGLRKPRALPVSTGGLRGPARATDDVGAKLGARPGRVGPAQVKPDRRNGLSPPRGRDRSRYTARVDRESACRLGRAATGRRAS